MLKAFGGGVLAFIAYIGCSFPAIGPAHGDVAPLAGPTASLTRSGTDLVVTGALDIFESASFTGPNRSSKQDRMRPFVGVMEHTSSFDGIRARLAALRAPKEDPVQVAAVTPAPAGPEPVQVASIPSPEGSDALDAITSAAPDMVIPKRRPETQLAYLNTDDATPAGDAPVKSKDGKKWSEKEMWCLATAIYFEARGEIQRGQVAVAQVVLNRVKHRLYPSTICGVVFQNQHKRNACQFSFACDGIPERINEPKPWKLAQEIARGVADGSLYIAEVGHSTHYHATYVYPHWAPRMKKNTKIGLHVFYQFKRGWKFG